jgi:hypothetical protein
MFDMTRGGTICCLHLGLSHFTCVYAHFCVISRLIEVKWEASFQKKSVTIENKCFGDYIFVGTDEYIQIIFIGFETDEYNIIFVS